MALKQPYMNKDCLDGALSSLKVAAKPGESLRVKGLRFGALASRGFHECFIDRVSVGYFYVGDVNANHLEQWSIGTLVGNVFALLIQKGIHSGFPIAEGQTFEVKPSGPADQVIGSIEYEIGDKDDFKPEMPNGSKAKEFVFLNYGTNKTAVSFPGTAVIDMSRNPSEYPAFPFGENVPPKTKVEIYGFLLMCWKDSAGTANPNYGYLRLMKDREVLFDEDRKGIWVREGMGQLTWGPCRQVKADIELFPEPLIFGPGEELRVEITAPIKDVIQYGVDLVSIQKVITIE